MTVIWLTLTAFIVVVVAIAAFDMGYQRGREDGGATVYANTRRSLFSALRERCADPLMSREARDGAWQTVRRVVRHD